MSLVSVIITTYNRPDYLAETLKSVVGQTYESLEIIVVDDGSATNEAEKVCASVHACKYYKIKNQGVAAARNYGLKQATGDYIAFLDDDDLWLPHKIAKQVLLLEAHSDFDLTHCPCEIIDEHSKKTGQIIGRHKDPNLKHGDVKMRMMASWTLMMPSVLLKRSLIDKVGSFNEAMPQAGEDMEFWTRCSFYTKFYYFDEPLALYRKHGANISSENSKYSILPLYLYAALLDVYAKNRIAKTEFKTLKQKIRVFQSRFASSNLYVTLKNLFKIDRFWFLNYSTVKSLVASIIYKK